ncbi:MULTISPECIES: hypothetical protein [unclassified Arthrobacter]|uniref:hypothetical protein n=1 Tax=unclassified Arthrobacter TaxID=235627 RepID=UPI001D138A41|nr:MULTISPECIES: hypothetical protein [unclassified Arthrobacter]MCC3276747.1 hypothetical protein [Arthrobacter sp. zg-Y20]MCC3277822.1 hypothetical protein [Arthrobacter sp. zg-Y40]MCC9176226.1 hypothetical protein [Arthrobacter sp. zg-Y750]MDK1316905.1 hypothetical protein [Arthrobacter sp. zg.Y20]MDK1327082.1 hypothetical protein [Arthrobacter sp. zg-Y1143]
MLGGITAAVLGTSLHNQVVYAGDTGLPVGAVLAVVFSCAVALLAGLWQRSAAVSAAAGVITYLLLGLFSLDLLNEAPLIVTGAAAEEQPPVVTAGLVWLFGQAVATVGAVLACTRVLARDRAAAKAA